MKKRYYILVLAIIILTAVWFLTNKTQSKTEETTSEYSETEVIKTDIINTLSNSSYVSSALEEKKELHATYYFEEIYFEKNQYIEAGQNILKYTNGKYMVAPYNCVITNLSIPNSEEKCTNQHYITIQSTDTLSISMQIEENELDTIYLGQEASIEIDTLSNNIIGYVINIANTATYSSSSSTFAVEVEFQNDGNILLGMSAKCSVILEKAEGVIAVANEAIEEQNGKKYVTTKLSDGSTKQVEIETGISNDAYTEVKSGLKEGDIVIIEEEEESSIQNMMIQRMQGGNMQQGGFEQRGNQNMQSMPQMPSGGMMPQG